MENKSVLNTLKAIVLNTLPFTFLAFTAYRCYAEYGTGTVQFTVSVVMFIVFVALLAYQAKQIGSHGFYWISKLKKQEKVNSTSWVLTAVAFTLAAINLVAAFIQK